MKDEENFEDLAGEGSSSLFGEMFAFMADNKKWWLLPIVIVLSLLGILLILGAVGAAPFIYALI